MGVEEQLFCSGVVPKVLLWMAGFKQKVGRNLVDPCNGNPQASSPDSCNFAASFAITNGLKRVG